MSAAHRAGYGGKCAKFVKHGADFVINKVWDKENGGFYWMTNRDGEVTIDKILYGLSFAIYGLTESATATCDPRGLEYVKKTFDLGKKYAADTMYGGYFKMLERTWVLCDPGHQGGDRKTLDVHMHLMEALTNMYECTKQDIHRRTLLEDIDILLKRIMYPRSGTGIPQFTRTGRSPCRLSSR